MQQVQGLLRATDNVLWISSASGLENAIPAKKARTLLGQEFDTLVFDAHSGFDVNAFAAVSGTLCGGGTLFLLTPPLDGWADFPDPDYRRFIPHPYQPEDVEGRFLRRFVGMLKTLTPQFPFPEEEGEPDQDRFLSLSFSGRQVGVREQQHAIATIVQSSRIPVVLTADRGRGKSAALGMAASRLVKTGKRVLLTAPSRAAAESVFRHAQHPPAFFAPDDLLQTLPEGDVLLVDEAAAIPLPLLLKMLGHYPRCVFSTTLHGYEGSGRGFALRFQKALDVLAPGWQSIRLHQPIRWSENDPLEQFINQTLLLDVELAPCPDKGRAGDGFLHSVMDREALTQNEPLLRQIFSLLVNAHYQTRPSDLRQMLDAPDISLHVLEQGGDIVAVALLSREGGLDTELTAAIYAGKRRPHGHPVPQTLTFHAGIAGAAEQVCERVMRIAVHPDLQGMGLGSQLLQALVEYARTSKADYISVSYAASPELLHFWNRGGFVPVRIGFRRDTASGRHSFVQVRPLSEAGKQLCATAEAHFRQSLPGLLDDQLRDLEPELIREIQPAGKSPVQSGK